MSHPKTNPEKVLIAGVGNDLRLDDAFGLLVIRELIDKGQFPANIKLLEVGIGGIHLVQELHGHYDVLVLIDAVSWGEQPGHVYFREVETADISEMPREERRSFLADMHYTNPTRALMLAKALNVLPFNVFILGCEAKETEGFEIRTSEEVNKAIPKAIKTLNSWLSERYDF